MQLIRLMYRHYNEKQFIVVHADLFLAFMPERDVLHSFFFDDLDVRLDSALGAVDEGYWRASSLSA